MSALSDTEVRRLDFMLLLVLREGVRQRKLSDVATTLGVTQTAISHSVARLRVLFDDELFIRRPHGVEPTARAVHLATIAERVLAAAGAMLSDPTPFDPATEDRALRICALDFEVALISGVIETLHREAPGIQLRFQGLGRDAAVAALERDEADLWLGFSRSLPVRLERVALFDESYKVIARLGHPRISSGAGIDLDTYCAERHIVMSADGSSGGIVDRTLRMHGRVRTVAVTTSGFLSAFDLVARTDLIATVPSRLAAAQEINFRLSVNDPPVTPRPFQVCATWHRRSNGDPALAWFVHCLRSAL